MLRILFTSGEEVASLDASELDALETHGSTVGSLKRHLAEKHLNCSRFLLRLLGDCGELQDDSVLPQMDLHLVRARHLPADAERDEGFLYCCVAGKVEEVELALKELQNPNVSNDAGSAVCLAVRQGHLDVVSLLLEAGVDTESVDDMERSSLHHAASAGDVDLVHLLLKFGAEMGATDAMQRRPLHWAALSGHGEVFHLLQKWGAEDAADCTGRTAAHYLSLRLDEARDA